MYEELLWFVKENLTVICHLLDFFSFCKSTAKSRKIWNTLQSVPVNACFDGVYKKCNINNNMHNNNNNNKKAVM